MTPCVLILLADLDIFDKQQVDRHIRLIDQAIKEQEMSISMGSRPGTQPVPIVLQNLQVPRWSRPTRTVYSPILDEGEQPEGGVKDGTTLGIATRDTADIKKQHKGMRGNENVGRKKPEMSQDHVTSVELGQRRNTRSRKLSAIFDLASPERFCFCNGVSFGTVCFPATHF